MTCSSRGNEPTAPKRTMKIIQGQTWFWQLGIKINGTDMDSSWSARAQIRRTVADPEIAYTITAMMEAPNVKLSIPAEDSSGWDFTGGVYDVEIYKTSGGEEISYRVVQGDVRIGREVTR